LKWASKQNIDYWLKMEKPMKGEWAIPEKKNQKKSKKKS
jgi:hypothetical protein